jgi:sporulation protein YlmC with PRC-barrel domain
MSTRNCCLGLAFTLSAAMVGASLFGGDDKSAAGKDDKSSAEAQPHFRAKQILGSKVNLEGNTKVGTVDDIVLDENGNVDYLIVQNSENRLVTVPWDATRLDSEKRTAVVHITPEKFQQVPTYTVETYPVFSVPYRTRVYGYYGLTPGQERRAIRRGAVVVP